MIKKNLKITYDLMEMEKKLVKERLINGLNTTALNFKVTIFCLLFLRMNFVDMQLEYNLYMQDNDIK